VFSNNSFKNQLTLWQGDQTFDLFSGDGLPDNCSTPPGINAVIVLWANFGNFFLAFI
jgi:hypothetical protein